MIKIKKHRNENEIIVWFYDKKIKFCWPGKLINLLLIDVSTAAVAMRVYFEIRKFISFWN